MHSEKIYRNKKTCVKESKMKKIAERCKNIDSDQF